MYVYCIKCVFCLIVACACMNVYPCMFDVRSSSSSSGGGVSSSGSSSMISSICGVFLSMIIDWCLVYIVYS